MTYNGKMIIDPRFKDNDLCKADILYLLGAGGQDDLLDACDEAVNWIKSLPYDVTGQWIWEHCPTPHWYIWLLQELWTNDIELELYGDQDLYDIGEAIGDWMEYEGIDEELQQTVAWTCRDEWVEAARFHHEERVGPLREKNNRLWEKYRDAASFSDEYDAYDKEYRLSHNKMMDAEAEAERLFDASGGVQAVYEQWAETLRNDTELLPSWTEVREVLRTYYRLNSIHAKKGK